jgi:hypothetical protein
MLMDLPVGEFTDEQRARLKSLSGSIDMLMDLSPKQMQEVFGREDSMRRGMDRIERLTPEQRQQLLIDNGLILAQNGGLGTEKDVKLETDKVMRQILRDIEELKRKDQALPSDPPSYPLQQIEGVPLQKGGQRNPIIKKDPKSKRLENIGDPIGDFEKLPDVHV